MTTDPATARVADRGHRRLDIPQLASLDRAAFVARFGGVLEHSPQFADRAFDRAPFADVDGLHAAFVAAVADAPDEERLQLIRAHPELAGKAAIAGTLGPESTQEQVAAGLDRLTPEQHRRLTRATAAYRERFGFPFVVCAREHTQESIVAAAESRLAAPSVGEEERTALAEIAKIARLRLEDLVEDRP